jgi:hypothetical protein
MSNNRRCKTKFTAKAVCLLILCVSDATGDLTEDLTKDLMAFPPFSDLPLCGSCRVAHVTGYCAGKHHIVSLTGCKTASCLCDASREETITGFILREAGAACGTKDTATPGRALDVYKAFCASQPAPTSLSPTTVRQTASTRSTDPRLNETPAPAGAGDTITGDGSGNKYDCGDGDNRTCTINGGITTGGKDTGKSEDASKSSGTTLDGQTIGLSLGLGLPALVVAILTLWR